MTSTTENYTFLRTKIKQATTLATLARLDRSCDRIYNAQQLSESEFSRLTVLIMVRHAIIETA